MHLFGSLVVSLLLVISAPGKARLPAEPERTVAIEMGTRSDQLYLATGTVDLSTAAIKLNRALRPTETFDPSTHYVIQLDSPITNSRRHALLAAGIELGDYLPMNAYVVRGDQLAAADWSQLAFVRWVGPFRNEWKVVRSPATRTQTLTQTGSVEQLTPAAAELDRIVIGLFEGTDVAEATSALLALGVTIRDVEIVDDHTQFEAEFDASRVAELSTLEGVQYVGEAADGVPRNATTTWIAQSNVTNFTPLWDHGLHGEGQILGLIDWDLDEDHCAFKDVVPPGPTHRKIIEYFGNNAVPGVFGYHGTHVGCTLAGDELAGTEPNFKGMAYKAKLVIQHQPAAITPTDLNDRLAYAHSFGARVHSNSWGSTNDTTYSAWPRDIDVFTRNNEEDVVVVSIMNGSSSSAPGSIRTPENAKNCIAVGASMDTPNQENHGSGARGPTVDGRQKPEIWIPGCPISANVSTACGSVDRQCATSWCAPAASGFAGLVRQYFVSGFYPSGTASVANQLRPTGALVRAIMANSAVDMSGFAGYFGTQEGWGRVKLDDAMYFAGDTRGLVVRDVYNAQGLSTNEFTDYRIGVTSAAERLKITLTWTDAPGTLGAAFAPVNNLDLIVTDPAGNLYRGNVFSGADSIPGGSADPRNNTEQVHISNPSSGPWTVRVMGTAVNVGRQGYALVVTGALQPDVP